MNLNLLDCANKHNDLLSECRRPLAVRFSEIPHISVSEGTEKENEKCFQNDVILYILHFFLNAQLIIVLSLLETIRIIVTAVTLTYKHNVFCINVKIFFKCLFFFFSCNIYDVTTYFGRNSPQGVGYLLYFRSQMCSIV